MLFSKFSQCPLLYSDVEDSGWQRPSSVFRLWVTHLALASLRSRRRAG